MLNKWIKYWRKGGKAPTTDELNATDRKELDQLGRLWEAANPPKSNLSVDTDAAWNRLEDRLFGGTEAEEPRIRQLRPGARARKFPLWAAAAALVGIALAAWWLTAGDVVAPQNDWVAEANLEESARLVVLPDGSEVWLNSNSSLRFSEAFEERRVELEGEGFFDVVRDETRPFVVATGEVETRVLGTSFNVRAYAEEEVEVSVKSGRVEVAAIEATSEEVLEKVVLNPGQAATYELASQELSEAVEAIDQVDAWRTEELVFGELANTTIGQALPTLSRFYGKDIRATREFLDCPLRGTYQNTPLNELLEDLEFIFIDFSFIEEGDTITLSGSCQ